MAKRTFKNRKARRPHVTVSKRKPPVSVERKIYWPDHLDHVRVIAAKGLTDDEMASFMGISETLLQSWKAYYPGLKKAIEEGRTQADADVVVALHRNAVGYEHETDEVVRTRRGAQVVTVKKYYPGETQAQKFWLQNRRKEDWNAATQLQVTGKKDSPVHVKVENKDSVINSILNLIMPRPDGDGLPPSRKE